MPDSVYIPNHLPGATPRCLYHSRSLIPSSDINPRSKAESFLFTLWTHFNARMIFLIGICSRQRRGTDVEEVGWSAGQDDRLDAAGRSFALYIWCNDPSGCPGSLPEVYLPSPPFNDLSHAVRGVHHLGLGLTRAEHFTSDCMLSCASILEEML